MWLSFDDLDRITLWVGGLWTIISYCHFFKFFIRLSLLILSSGGCGAVCFVELCSGCSGWV